MRSRFVNIGLAVMASLTLAHSAQASTEKSKDIAGIVLGDTIAVAKEKMLKANPNLSVVEIPNRDGGVFGILAQEVKNPQESNEANIKEEFFIIPTSEDKVGIISRFIALDENTVLTRKQLIDALRDKYGDNSKGSIYNETRDSRFLWAFHKDGKLLPMYSGSCGSSSFNSTVGYVSIEGRSHYSTGKFISSYNENCKVMLEASFKVGDMGVIQNYAVSMGDVAGLYKDAVAYDNKQKDELAAKKAAIEKAAQESGAPKL